MRLLGNTVLLNNFRPLTKPEASGILLPDNRHVPGGPVVGTIASVGSKANKKLFQIGLNVIVSSYIGTPLPDGQKIYDTEDILALVD